MKFLLALVAPIVSTVLKGITGNLREMIGEGVQGWHAHALTTETQVDDYATRFLAGVLGVDISNVQPAGAEGENYTPVAGIDYDEDEDADPVDYSGAGDDVTISPPLTE